MKNNQELKLEVDTATEEKFEAIMGDESMIQAGMLLHESNNVNIPEVPETGAEG